MDKEITVKTIADKQKHHEDVLRIPMTGDQLEEMMWLR